MSGIAALPPIPTYNLVSAHETADVAQFETTDTQTKADIAYFEKVAPTLTTPAALLGNYRALSVVLNAFGMSANIGQTALLKQFMTQSPTASTSTANQIGNPLYIRFATAMAQFSPPPFSTQSGINAVVTALATNNFEASQDTLSPGIGDALYFKRTIGSVTSLAQLMSDPTLLKVATTATNMPSQFGSLDYDQQVQLLSAQINVSDFNKPGFADQFVTKYLAMNEANSSTVADPSGALAILNGTGSASDMLSSLFPQSSSSSSDGILSLFA
jgi:hypothetical protein